MPVSVSTSFYIKMTINALDALFDSPRQCRLKNYKFNAI